MPPPTHNLKPGPFETNESATSLPAHIVKAGTDPTLHGYALHDDLARNYLSSDLELLSLTGELPSESQSRAFGIARAFMMAPHPGGAANQAASITHMLNPDERATVMVAIQMCANEAFDWATKQQAILSWLDSDDQSRPLNNFCTRDKQDTAAVTRLMALLDKDANHIRGLTPDLSLDAALTCVFYYCNLNSVARIQTIRSMAALPAVVAQGVLWQSHQLPDYPTQLPNFSYQDDASATDTIGQAS